MGELVLTTDLSSLSERNVPTPVTSVEMTYRGRTSRVLLKQESFGSTGSVKDRTALGLVAALHRQRPLTPGTVIVESTSGNLGLALAWLLRRLDCRFVVVIDPKTPVSTCEALRAMAAELCLVDEPDEHGSYLLSRLRRVQALCAEDPAIRWTDQYGNPANPAAHRLTTGPEIARQAGPGLDAVYIAVSTGGTLAGTSAYLRVLNPAIRMVAVDSEGSRVTGTGNGPERLIPGIGSSRKSTFLRPGSYDYAVQATTAEIVAVCRLFRSETGIALGGSSGAVVSAMLADLAAGRAGLQPVGLCADGGAKYTSTIYDDAWLERVGIARQVSGCLDRFDAEGVTFRWRPDFPVPFEHGDLSPSISRKDT